MPTRTKLRAGVKSILKLAAPIGAANLAIVCSGTIDTIMAGQTSAEDLAGVALGIAVATWISISLAGILQGVSPISGFAFGAKRFREVGDSLHQCLYLAVGLAVPGLVLTQNVDGCCRDLRLGRRDRFPIPSFRRPGTSGYSLRSNFHCSQCRGFATRSIHVRDARDCRFEDPRELVLHE